MRIKDEVTAFQLGSSTVVTIPKSMGIRPGQKLKIKKSKNGATLKLDKRQSLLDALEKARGILTDQDWRDYQRRRKLEIAAAQKTRKAW